MYTSRGRLASACSASPRPVLPKPPVEPAVKLSAWEDRAPDASPVSHTPT